MNLRYFFQREEWETVSFFWDWFTKIALLALFIGVFYFRIWPEVIHEFPEIQNVFKKSEVDIAEFEESVDFDPHGVRGLKITVDTPEKKR